MWTKRSKGHSQPQAARKRQLLVVRFLCLLWCAALAIHTAMALAATAEPGPRVSGEKRVALVVGNNTYPGAALANPVNDATAMAEALRQLGFEVNLQLNATQRQMTRAIGEFGKNVAAGSVALFYYAGHGLQSRGRNFLVPIDADISHEGSVSTESVDVERVLDQLGPARLSMVILDACRNNPYERRYRTGAGAGLAQIDAPTGTLIAYATAPGRVALDGDARHGTYTEALLDAIMQPGLRVEDVFKQVRINVLKRTRNQQIPWESSSLTGDFYFRPRGDGAALDATTTDVTGNAREQSAQLQDQFARLSAEVASLRRNAPEPESAVPRYTAAWQERLAELRKQRGTLDMSRALSVLLDVPRRDAGPAAAEDAAALSRIEAFARDAQRRPYSVAVAFGVDASGFLVWGGSFLQAHGRNARDVAVGFCASAGGAKCHSVMVDGENMPEAWFEIAKLLGRQSVAAVRSAFLKTLSQPLLQAPSGMSRNTGVPNPMAYTFSRERGE
jgi:hypothetical protein